MDSRWPDAWDRWLPALYATISPGMHQSTFPAFPGQALLTAVVAALQLRTTRFAREMQNTPY